MKTEIITLDKNDFKLLTSTLMVSQKGTKNLKKALKEYNNLEDNSEDFIAKTKVYTTDDLLDEFMGVIGTSRRDEFEKKVKRAVKRKQIKDKKQENDSKN